MEYAKKFTGLDYSKLFFVVFDPDASLIDYSHGDEQVKLLKGKDIAELIIDLGLTNWVVQKLM